MGSACQAVSTPARSAVASAPSRASLDKSSPAEFFAPRRKSLGVTQSSHAARRAERYARGRHRVSEQSRRYRHRGRRSVDEGGIGAVFQQAADEIGKQRVMRADRRVDPAGPVELAAPTTSSYSASPMPCRHWNSYCPGAKSCPPWRGCWPASARYGWRIAGRPHPRAASNFRAQAR